MSIHKSLNLGGGISTQRSVWTRRERIEKLLEEERISEEDRPTGLPKVRTNFKVLTRKQIKAKEAAALIAAGEEVPEDLADALEEVISDAADGGTEGGVEHASDADAGGAPADEA